MVTVQSRIGPITENKTHLHPWENIIAVKGKQADDSC